MTTVGTRLQDDRARLYSARYHPALPGSRRIQVAEVANSAMLRQDEFEFVETVNGDTGSDRGTGRIASRNS